MKAFNSWWNSEGKYICENDPENAWKSALKWALTHKYGMSGSEIISTEDLEEELNEETNKITQ